MARPKAQELTERELEVMQVFWRLQNRSATIAEIQETLNSGDRELAYTTVATLVRILVDKRFLKQTTTRRPHEFAPTRSEQEVSGRLLRELMQRVFGGSAEALVMRLMEDQELSDGERERLRDLVQNSNEHNEE